MISLKDIARKIGLQFFADAGTSVNVTTGTVNAYNGTATTSDAMDPMLKAFYDTELLENVRTKLVYSQFGKKQTLPKRHNGIVEWRKWNVFARADKLTEGVIPTGQTFGSTKLVGSVDQYGTYTAISDVLELQSYDDIIMGATEEMGASAAETQEVLTRNALLAGTNVLYCDNLSALENGTVKSTPTSTGTMGYSSTNGYSILTPTMVNKAVTILKKLKAPTINGKYVAVVHPSVLYNLREDEKWIEAHKYASVQEIFNGEVGELHGVRFIEDADAPVLTSVDGTSYANAEGGATYASYFFGKDAFGIIDPEGGALEMIIKDKSEVGGPLNQFSTIGYKFTTNGATILYNERMIRVMSCSEFSADDASNY